MKFKEIWNKAKKPLLYGALALPIITGTFGGNEEGCMPLKKKVGISYGVNIGMGTTEFTPGSKFYGVNISPVTLKDENSSITGLSLSFLSFTEFTGIESKVNGVEISGLNGSYKGIINGLQIGGLNLGKSGDIIQFGLNNMIILPNGDPKKSVLLNYNFE